ncbi:hypothetical protein EDD11_004818 [Mortierella claussenii]|nr:hypothetical protein EDD11_004818 [Mortierella claussenii]
MDWRNKDMNEFTSGLKSISRGRDAVATFAASLLQYLKTTEGIKLLENAQTTIRLRTSAQQRSHAEYEFTSTVARTEFVNRARLEAYSSTVFGGQSSSSADALKSRLPRPRAATTSPLTKRKSSAIAEPWRSVVEMVLAKIDGGEVALPQEWPHELTGRHKLIYQFIASKIEGLEPILKVDEKDVLVAMSGIINARMDKAREVFGEDVIEGIKAQCLRPNISTPSEELRKILAPIEEAFEIGGVDRMLDVVEAQIGVEAACRLKGETTSPLKRRVLDAVRHICVCRPSKTMSEGELVGLWSHVIKALAGYKLTLRSGELTSRATQWQRLLLKQEYNIDAGTATYGRKVDLQCRIDELELNNSEFKVDMISSQQVGIQYRKNLRINQAMMLFLKKKVGLPLEDLEVLALDVHGLSAVIFSVKYDSEVFVSDLASKHMLRMPDSPASWRLFLRGDTLSVLVAYVEHLVTLAKKVEMQELLHEEEVRTADGGATPEWGPGALGSFTLLSPTKKRCAGKQPEKEHTQDEDDMDDLYD